MKNICLIPVTRPSIANNAIKSAESDGWSVITLEDKEKNGPHIIREKLLNIALKEKASIIRYMDDDDILLPHLQKLNFENNDIIYIDHKIVNNKNSEIIILSGNPECDALSIHPWSWIAKANSLNKIKELNSYLWNPQKPHREGGWCWFNFLQANLKIKHLRTIAYQWNINKISYKDTNSKLENDLLKKALNERHNFSKTSIRNR